MQIGALVIGIENYVDAWYRQSQFRLQYAIEDAKAFERYLTTAWQGHTLHLRCLPNEKATKEDIFAAATWLAEQSVEILFVYLSGHGDKDPEGNGWFCLADATPGKRSLDGSSIDRIFATVGARTSLLLLDCCYAESVLSSSRFFSALQNAQARLFLCSSRADQPTWEDHHVRHGIFSNILLRGLSTASPVASPSGLVDVEAALFPYLCEQVPLAVVAAKGEGERQEPVKGGISSRPILVPTVSASLLGRQLSTYDAVRLGTRRWLGRIAGAAILALVTIQLAFYHLAIGPTGEIEVRPGLKATEAFAFFGSPVETGITQAALATDVDDPAGKLRPQLVGLAERRLWGISLHRQADGLKGWFGQLLPMLRRGDRANFVVLATGRLPADYAGADPEREAPPFRTVLEAAFLGSDSLPDVAAPFRFDYDLPTAAGLDCAKTVANIRDFNLTEPASSVIAADLSWSTARAVFQPSAAIDQAVDASKVVAYRISLANQSPRHYSAGTEAHALAAMLLAISKISASTGSITSHSTVPAAASESWCEPGLAIARLFLGGQDVSRKGAIALAGDVRSDADTVNDPVASARSEAALAGLQVLATSGEIPAQAIDAIVRVIEPHEQGLDGEPAISEWLRSIAPHQAFPPRDIDWLFSQLKQSSDNFNFSPLTAFNILSRTAAHLDTEKQQLLAAWYAKHFAEHRTQSVFADAVGYLGAVVPLSPDPALFLSERLLPEIHISGRGKTRRGTLIIRSTDFDAGVGLGVIGQAKTLPGEVVDKLYRFAVARTNLGDLRDVYAGLAAQRTVTVDGLAASVMAGLAATSGNRMKRQVEIEIAIARILHQAADDRRRVIQALRQRWNDEPEPELKIALAQVIVGSKLRIADISLPIDSANSDDADN